jgi:hypothetical protein
MTWIAEREARRINVSRLLLQAVGLRLHRLVPVAPVRRFVWWTFR